MWGQKGGESGSVGKENCAPFANIPDGKRQNPKKNGRGRKKEKEVNSPKKEKNTLTEGKEKHW